MELRELMVFRLVHVPRLVSGPQQGSLSQEAQYALMDIEERVLAFFYSNEPYEQRRHCFYWYCRSMGELNVTVVLEQEHGYQALYEMLISILLMYVEDRVDRCLRKLLERTDLYEDDSDVAVFRDIGRFWSRLYCTMVDLWALSWVSVPAADPIAELKSSPYPQGRYEQARNLHLERIGSRRLRELIGDRSFAHLNRINLLSQPNVRLCDLDADMQHYSNMLILHLHQDVLN